MVWNAVPVAILAGVIGYASILFYGLYLALAKSVAVSERREYLTFALTCFAAAAYCVSCTGLYNADSLEDGIFWMRGTLLTAACIGISYQAFVWDFLKTRMPTALKLAAVVLAVLGLMVASWDSPHTFTTARPAIKHVELFGRSLVYHEGEAGIVDQVLMLVFFLVYALNVGYLVRGFVSRAGRAQPGQLGFLIATFVSGAAATNDFLVTGLVYQFVYTFEYGFSAILIAMGYVLLMRFGALHDAVKSLNQELTRTNSELVLALEQAKESIRVKTEFLASMSHELRTPLNAIINLPQQLSDEFVRKHRVTCSACGAAFELDEGEVLDPHTRCGACEAEGLSQELQSYFVVDAPTATRWLATVTRASKNLLGLVDDVLDASKLELGRTMLAPSAFEPLSLLGEVIDSARAIGAQKGVTVHLEPTTSAESMGPIVADRVKLGQVLFNVVGNAVKFSPSGGLVEITYEQPKPGESLIRVRDHGMGIAPEHHELIFEKFRQVDGGATRAHGGTGLGLAISKSLVELHGGQIWVESAPGTGATFFIKLPALTLPERSALTTSSRQTRAALALPAYR
jgi:signal transduction histidine kinase